MLPITQRERSGALDASGTTRLTFTLDAWPVPFNVEYTGNVHSDALHPVGFSKIVHVRGQQHIAIFQQVAPVNNVTDMAIVAVADTAGKVKYQCLERGAELQFTTHHIPAFLFLETQQAITAKPASVTVCEHNAKTFSVDAKCTDLYLVQRTVRHGSITSAIWRTVAGAYIVQDYDAKHRVCQHATHAEAHTAIYHAHHADAPNLDIIPRMPYELFDIQAKYNTSWMRKQYRIHSASGMPLVQVENMQNVFTYPNGVTVGHNYVRYPDGRIERPEQLFQWNATERSWMDSAFRLKMIQQHNASPKQQESKTSVVL